MSEEHESEIKRAIRLGLSKGEGGKEVFQVILDHLETVFQRGCHGIAELKKRSLKSKGTIFEVFCVMFLKARGYPNVWLLGDVPENLRVTLGLATQDLGIDIVAQDSAGGYSAVQAKYRIKSIKKPKTSVPWSALSTFYALCQRTGPWVRHIVVTNCNFVSRRGRKGPLDQTIALQTFQNLPRSFWVQIIGDMGHRLVEEKTVIPTAVPQALSPGLIPPLPLPPTLRIIKAPLTAEEVRNLRLKHFAPQAS